jgi:hypothetical protein
MKSTQVYYDLLEQTLTPQAFYEHMIGMLQSNRYFFAPHLEMVDFLEARRLPQERKALLRFAVRNIAELLSDAKSMKDAQSVWTKREGGDMLEVLRKYKAGKSGNRMRLPVLSMRARMFYSTLPDAPEDKAKNLVLEKNVDISTMQQEVARNEPCWLVDTARQENVIFHKDTNAIALRTVPERSEEFVARDGPHESLRTPLAIFFPDTIKAIERFAQEKNAGLARVVIVRLKPHSRVYRHADTEVWLRGRERYHLVIQSKQGSLMTSGVEKKVFQEGELFLFNNKVMHTAENESNDWRIHVIFDMKLPG